MFFVKNIPAWERWLRVGAGAALIGGGLFLFQRSALEFPLAMAGIAAALTGVIGFCPMCALAGRRLKKGS